MKKDPCWKGYEMVGTKKKDGKTVPNCVPKTKKECTSFSDWMKIRESEDYVPTNNAFSDENSFSNWMEAKEGKKPYKNFNPKKNHPEGGLKPSYAHKMGIHAGIETKREAEKAGGVSKMSEKTQARRKSFCARMSKAGTEKSRNDPNSKQNAALRVWKC